MVNNSFGGLKFGVDSNGNYGYIKAGADAVTPFKSDDLIGVSFNCVSVPNNGIGGTYSIDCSKKNCTITFNITSASGINSYGAALLINGVVKQKVYATGSWSFSVDELTSVGISVDTSGSATFRYANGTITFA